MAGHPLRSATDRCLGGPLPRQQANQTRAHPVLPELSPQGHAAPREYAVLAAVSGCCPPVRGRLPTRCSPVRHSVPRGFPPEGSAAGASFDLHVLGTPPAFILSQDQTLMLKSDPSSGRFPRLQNVLAPGSPRAFILSPVFTVFKVLRSPARVRSLFPFCPKTERPLHPLGCI